MTWSDQARESSGRTKMKAILDRWNVIDEIPTREIVNMDLQERLGLHENTARHTLNRLTELGYLVKVRHGVWARVAKVERKVG